MKMAKLSQETLGKTAEALINDKKTKGKILAIARYVEDEKICFQTAEGKNGAWIPALTLVDYKKLTVSSSESNILVTLPKTVIDSVEKEAEKSLISLVKFADDLAKSIENKAASDIELVNGLINETQKLADNMGKDIDKSGKNTIKFINQCLQELNLAIGKAIDEISDTIQKIWSEFVRNCVAMAMKKTQESFDSAKKVVDEFREKHPKKDDRQIAQILINRSTSFSVASGIAMDAIKSVESLTGLSIGLDLFKNSVLLSELVYQISIAYGFDGDTKITTGEGIAIIALSLGIDVLQQLGLGALTSASLGTAITVKAVSNIALFQLVGYASCSYFELKQQNADNPLISASAYQEFTAKLQVYLDETLSETDKLEEIMKDAIQIEKRIPAFANA